MFDDQDDPFKEYATPPKPAPRPATTAPKEPLGKTKLGLPLWDDRQARKAKEIEDAGYEITATTNGRHAPNSPHYSRTGFDIRTKDLHPDSVAALQRDISSRKGAKIDYERRGANANTTNEHLHYDFTNEVDGTPDNDPFAGYSQPAAQSKIKQSPQQRPPQPAQQRAAQPRPSIQSPARTPIAPSKLGFAEKPAFQQIAEQSIANTPSEIIIRQPDGTVAKPQATPQPKTKPGLLERVTRGAINMSPIGLAGKALGKDYGGAVVEGAQEIGRQAEDFAALPGDWSNSANSLAKGLRKAVRSAPQAAASLVDALGTAASPTGALQMLGANRPDPKSQPLAEAVQPWTQAQNAETDRIYQEKYGIDPNKKTKSGVVFESIGQSIPLLAGGAAGLGAKGVGLIGAGMNAQQAYSEARAKGATPEEASRAATIAAPIGALEGVLGAEAQLAKLGVNRVLAQKAGQILKTTGKDLAQEEITELANNLNAASLSGYDKNRRLLDNVVETAIGSLGMSGAMGGASLASRGVNRVANAVNVDDGPIQGAIAEALDPEAVAAQQRAARSAVEQDTKDTVDRIFEQVMAEPAAAVAKQQAQSQQAAQQTVEQVAQQQAAVAPDAQSPTKLDGLGAIFGQKKPANAEARVAAKVDKTLADLSEAQATGDPDVLAYAKDQRITALKALMKTLPASQWSPHLAEIKQLSVKDSTNAKPAPAQYPLPADVATVRPDSAVETAAANAVKLEDERTGNQISTPEALPLRQPLAGSTVVDPQESATPSPATSPAAQEQVNGNNTTKTANNGQVREGQAIPAASESRMATPAETRTSDSQEQVNAPTRTTGSNVAPTGSTTAGVQEPQAVDRNGKAISIGDTVSVSYYDGAQQGTVESIRPDGLPVVRLKSGRTGLGERKHTTLVSSATPGVQEKAVAPLKPKDYGIADAENTVNEIRKMGRINLKYASTGEFQDLQRAFPDLFSKTGGDPDVIANDLAAQGRNVSTEPGGLGAFLRDYKKSQDELAAMRQRDAEYLKAQSKPQPRAVDTEGTPERAEAQQRIADAREFHTRAKSRDSAKGQTAGNYGKLKHLAMNSHEIARLDDATKTERVPSVASDPAIREHFNIPSDASLQDALNIIAVEHFGFTRPSEISPLDWLDLRSALPEKARRSIDGLLLAEEVYGGKRESLASDQEYTRLVEDVANASGTRAVKAAVQKAQAYLRDKGYNTKGTHPLNISEEVIKNDAENIRQARTDRASVSEELGQSQARPAERSPETAPRAQDEAGKPATVTPASADESANRPSNTQRAGQKPDVARAESDEQQVKRSKYSQEEIDDLVEADYYKIPLQRFVNIRAAMVRIGAGGGRVTKQEGQALADLHADIVRRAYDQGRTIPADVLKNYPNLAVKQEGLNAGKGNQTPLVHSSKRDSENQADVLPRTDTPSNANARQEGAAIRANRSVSPQESLTTSDLRTVQRKFASLQESATKSGQSLDAAIDDFLKQKSLIGDEFTPQQAEALREMARKDTKSRTATEAPSLFDAAPTSESKLKDAQDAKAKASEKAQSNVTDAPLFAERTLDTATVDRLVARATGPKAARPLRFAEDYRKNGSPEHIAAAEQIEEMEANRPKLGTIDPDAKGATRQGEQTLEDAKPKIEAQRQKVQDKEVAREKKAAEVEAVKEVWQQTRDEYIAAQKAEYANPKSSGRYTRAKVEWDYLHDMKALDLHKFRVIDALKRGDVVPAEVLADYPDLVPEKAEFPTQENAAQQENDGLELGKPDRGQTFDMSRTKEAPEPLPKDFILKKIRERKTTLKEYVQGIIDNAGWMVRGQGDISTKQFAEEYRRNHNVDPKLNPRGHFDYSAILATDGTVPTGNTQMDTSGRTAKDARVARKKGVTFGAIPESKGGTTLGTAFGAFAKFNEAQIPVLAKHFVTHAKSFGNWARAVMKDLGARVRPHLQAAWKALQALPKDERGILNEQRVVDGIKNLAKKAGFESNAQYGARKRAEIENSPEFRKWFGDSVVTEDGKAGGKPLMVYHGTRSAGFSEFDTFRQGGLTKNDLPGSYFTDRVSYASAAGGDQLMPVYLALRNPADSEAETNARYLADNQREKVTRGVTHRGEDGKLYLVKSRSGKEVRRILESQGYDGLLRENEYVAFSPTQIKSAFNRGTFDGSDANISSFLGAGQNPFKRKPKAPAAPDELIPLPPDFSLEKYGKELLGTMKALAKKGKLDPNGKIVDQVTEAGQKLIDAINAGDGAEVIKQRQHINRLLISRTGALLSDGLRPLMLAGDLLIGRQGFFGWITHPKISLDVLNATKGALSPTAKGDDVFYREFAKMMNDPHLLIAKQAVDFGVLHEVEVGKRLLQSEEGAFASGWANLPVIRQIEHFNKLYMDMYRLKVFSQEMDRRAKEGIKIADDKGKPTPDTLAYGKRVNIVSGRGELGTGKLHDAVEASSAFALLAPRWWISRLQVINQTANPISWAMQVKRASAGLTPETSKQIGKESAQILAAQAGMIGLGIAAAALGLIDSFNWQDPEEPEWMMAKKGNRRFSLMQGGVRPHVQFAGRLMKQMWKMAGTAVSEGRFDVTAKEKITENTQRYARTKLGTAIGGVLDQTLFRAPVNENGAVPPGMLKYMDEEDIAKLPTRGIDPGGNPNTVAESIFGRVFPLTYKNMFMGAWEEMGKQQGAGNKVLGFAKGGALHAPEFVGLDMNEYPNRQAKVEGQTFARRKYQLGGYNDVRDLVTDKGYESENEFKKTIDAKKPIVDSIIKGLGDVKGLAREELLKAGLKKDAIERAEKLPLKDVEQETANERQRAEDWAAIELDPRYAALSKDGKTTVKRRFTAQYTKYQSEVAKDGKVTSHASPIPTASRVKPDRKALWEK